MIHLIAAAHSSSIHMNSLRSPWVMAGAVLAVIIGMKLGNGSAQNEYGPIGGIVMCIGIAACVLYMMMFF